VSFEVGIAEPGNLLIDSRDQYPTGRFKELLSRFGPMKKGPSLQLMTLEPGLLAADGGLMEEDRLPGDGDHGRNRQGDGRDAHLFLSLISSLTWDFMLSIRFWITSPNWRTATKQQIPIRLEMMTYSITPWPF